MSLIGMISGPITVNNGDFGLSVPVQYFDDSDPSNVGYVDGNAPRVVLYHYTFPYPSTLQGTELQAQVRTDIKAKGLAFEAALAAGMAATAVLPAGSLVAVDG